MVAILAGDGDGDVVVVVLLLVPSAASIIKVIIIVIIFLLGEYPELCPGHEFEVLPVLVHRVRDVEYHVLVVVYLDIGHCQYLTID